MRPDARFPDDATQPYAGRHAGNRGILPRTRLPAEKRRDDDRVELPGLGARANGRASGAGG